MKLIALAFAVMVASPAPSSGQSFDISGGYQFLRSDSVSRFASRSEDLSGWFAQAHGTVTPQVGIVGEIGGVRKSYDFPAFEGFPASEASLRVTSLMTGVRASAPRSLRLVPFGQVLVGVSRVRARARAAGEAVDAFVDAFSEFAIQFGGGADFMFTNRVGVRGGGFFRRVATEDGSGDDLGIQTGIVVAIGRP
jgi:hypothetical protein